jgi:hypothetical protein
VAPDRAVSLVVTLRDRTQKGIALRCRFASQTMCVFPSILPSCFPLTCFPPPSTPLWTLLASRLTTRHGTATSRTTTGLLTLVRSLPPSCHLLSPLLTLQFLPSRHRQQLDHPERRARSLADGEGWRNEDLVDFERSLRQYPGQYEDGWSGGSRYGFHYDGTSSQSP